MPCVDCMTDWKPRGESAGARFRAPIGVLRRLEGGRLRLEQSPVSASVSACGFMSTKCARVGALCWCSSPEPKYGGGPRDAGLSWGSDRSGMNTHVRYC